VHMKDAIWKTFDFSGDAIAIFDLFKDEKNVFFLDSSMRDAHRGRYSFIGFDPFDTFQGKGENVLPELKKFFLQYKLNKGWMPSPFGAGLLGYFAYDLGLYFEKINLRAEDGFKLPDCFFGFYDCTITIDHLANKIHICSTGLPEKNSSLKKARAAVRLDYITQRLSEYSPGVSFKPKGGAVGKYSQKDINERLSSNFTKENYLFAASFRLS